METKKRLHCSRVGYVPLSIDFDHPGDRRRFAYYAKERNLSFEIADPFKSYDIIVLSQSADLSVWSKYNLGDAKVIYDFIDSYLAIPKTSITGWMRGPAKYFAGQSKYLQVNHWKAIERMCRRSDAVICSTKEQMFYINPFCSNVHIILDSQVEIVRKVKTDYSYRKPFRLVWEGLPQNLGSLKMLSPVFAKLSLDYSVELHVVTDPSFKRYLGRYLSVDSRELAKEIHKKTVFHEWHRTTLADIICACDLAVIPIDMNDMFALGKPENKLLLFWRMGMPVVTSAIPSYAKTMQAAGLYDAVYDSQGWLEKLSAVIKDEDLRERAALLGKAYADRYYAPSVILAQWDQIFESLGFSP